MTNQFKKKSVLEGKNLLLEEQILSLRIDPQLEELKNESGRVSLPESVASHLKVPVMTFTYCITQGRF